MSAFNFSGMNELGDGPGVLDPFASLPEKTPARCQIEVKGVHFSTDAGKKPCGLGPNKGFDRKMHYLILETRMTLVDSDALVAIEHPDSEPLPARTEETWLLLFPAGDSGKPWSAEERQYLSDRVKRAEGFLAPLYAAASMPLTADDGSAREGVPSSICKACKGRKGPLGKVPDGSWGEVKGMVFEGEVSRRQGNDGRDYYDYKILGLCPPASVGQIYTAGE